MRKLNHLKSREGFFSYFKYDKRQKLKKGQEEQFKFNEVLKDIKRQEIEKEKAEDEKIRHYGIQKQKEQDERKRQEELATAYLISI